jgi:hypothetical protein
MDFGFQGKIYAVIGRVLHIYDPCVGSWQLSHITGLPETAHHCQAHVAAGTIYLTGRFSRLVYRYLAHGPARDSPSLSGTCGSRYHLPHRQIL